MSGNLVKQKTCRPCSTEWVSESDTHEAQNNILLQGQVEVSAVLTVMVSMTVSREDRHLEGIFCQQRSRNGDVKIGIARMIFLPSQRLSWSYLKLPVHCPDHCLEWLLISFRSLHLVTSWAELVDHRPWSRSQQKVSGCEEPLLAYRGAVRNVRSVCALG